MGPNKKRKRQLCECGCGTKILKYHKNGRLKRFVNGHIWIGRKHSEETKKNYSKTRIGNHNRPKNEWNELSMKHKHARIKKIFPKSEHPICMVCKKKQSKELACITWIYEEDLKNWAWLCYSCHKEWDNIIPRLIINRKYKKRN